MQLDTSFGQWLKQLRRELDLTQDELARQVGCATATIQKIEADERRPSRQIAERLADCLELTGSARDTFLRMARARPPTSVPTPPTSPAAQALEERNVTERGAGAFTPASSLPTPAQPIASTTLPSGTVTFLFTD